MKHLPFFTFILSIFFSNLSFSQSNGSLNFDGVDDFISFPSGGPDLANESFTIEFIAKKDIGSDGYVVRIGDVENINQYLHLGWVGPETINFGFYSNDLLVTTVDDGLWHHWSVTYDAAAANGVIDRKVYRDGVLIGSNEASNNFIGTSVMEIGRGNFNFDDLNFAGSIDVVRIYTKALTEAEINARMGCTYGFGNDLYAEYRFSDGVANGANAGNTSLIPSVNTSSNHNGILNNFALASTSSNWISDAHLVLPTIIDQPLSTSIYIGDDLLLAANVDQGTCSSTTSVWYKNNVQYTINSSSTLSIPNVDFTDAGDYRLNVFQGGSGFFLSSDIATVTVNPKIVAKDNESDYFIDVNWELPIDPCLFDSNDDPYSEITLRLLRDGQEVFFQTYEGEELEEIYLDAYADLQNSPLTGAYRDYVGAGQSHTYDLMVFEGPFGNMDLECASQTDVGSTSAVKVPDNFMVTTDRLEEINVSWTNRSDLATSYKLFRDNVLIATIADGIGKDSIISFSDQYNFNSSTSIKSGEEYTYSIEMFSSFTGQTWPYTLGDGNTLDIDFQASKDQGDRVLLDWQDVASDQIDDYKLYRNNKLYVIKNAREIDHIDAFPLYGDSIIYQLRLIENDTVRASYDNKGFVAPNGSITGRVITEDGQFPVNNVIVKATRKSTGDTLSTVSNSVGEFSFSGLAYGLLDSFKIDATLASHNFTYFPKRSVGLSSTKPNFTDVIVLDDYTYSQGSTLHSLDLDAIGLYDQDRVVMDWEYSTNSPEVFLDIIRNGDVVYSAIETQANLVGQFIDLTGVPNEETKYQFRIYDIVGDAVSAVVKDTTFTFPDVSKIPNGNFTAVAETISANLTGNVTLQWTHTSQNIDGYRIYRNDSLVVELSQFILDYTDTEASFGEDLDYTITAIRKLGNTTYETRVPTPANPATINLGAMPAPTSVTITEIDVLPYNYITWTLPPSVTNEFNYTGYCIYRNDTLIRKQDKSLPLAADDFFGWGLSNITYKVSLYRATEEGIIESEKTEAAPSDFPEIVYVPTLTATANPAQGEISLSWDNSNLSNTDGIHLYYNGNFLVKLPSYIFNYVHIPSSGSGHYYQLYRSRKNGDTEILSTVFSHSNVNMSIATDVVYAPQNVMASRDLPNHVKLCWEYLDFVKSEFEITRNNVVIDNLPVGSRSYHDYTADPSDHQIAYKIRATQAGQFSQYVGAVGDIIDHKMVFGTITDTDTQLGIANVAINTTINGVVTIVAETDSSGYYSFYLPNELVGNTVSMAAYYSNNLVEATNILVSSEDHYEVNISIDIPEVFPYTQPATIEYANVDLDVYDLTGNISWQPSNANYDGVEITRGITVIDNVLKDDGNLYIDTTAVPGITYQYGFRAYQNTNSGKEFSEYYIKEFTYAPLSPVINLTATPLIDNNAVKVQWSHLYDHADGYVITRNGTFIKEVLTDSLFTFTDSTGIAGEQYTYTLTAYKILDGQIYGSDEKSVTLTFPGAATVKNLVLFAPYSQVFLGIQTNSSYSHNHVDLTWEYDGYNINGFKVFRDNELIATLPADSLHYKDFKGLPGTNTTYQVSAIVNQNDVSSESKKIEEEIIFPDFASPYEVFATKRSNIGDIVINWKYKNPGVDYFEIDIYRNGITENTFIINVDEEVLEEMTFEFIDKVSAPSASLLTEYYIRAHTDRNGVDYVATQYPFPQYYPFPLISNCSATQGTYDNAVKVTWEAPTEANVDSFTIAKYSLPDNVLAEEIVVAGGTRSYLDVFEVGVAVDSFEYKIFSGRIIDGNYQFFDEGVECSSVGYPKSVISVDNSFLDNTGTSFGRSVAVDGEWMVVGKFKTDEIIIYRFVNNEWVFHQQNSAGSGTQFGWAVDISDRLIVVGLPNDNSGSIVIFKLDDNDNWVNDEYIQSPGNGRAFGYSVAVDNEKIVVGHRNIQIANTPLQEMYQRGIRVFIREAGCPYSSSTCLYTELTVNPYAIDISSPYIEPHQSGFTVDIDGDDIISGMPFAPLRGVGTHPQYGVAAVYKIENGEVNVKELIAEFDTIPDGPEERFGYDVAFNNGKIAISSRRAIASNGNAGGKVSLYEYDPTINKYSKYQTLFADAPLNDVHYGECIVWKDNLLGVSEPYVTADYPIASRLYMYKENENTNFFEISQSPNPSSPKFREDFYDSGSPNKYVASFGFTFDISDHHVIVGSNAFVNPRVYPLDLYKVSVDNLIATDGTTNNTRISWDLGGCDDCPDDYIDSYNIYRDSELVGIVSAPTEQFFDEAANLESGASTAIAGKEYLYEVEAVINASFIKKSNRAADKGYSRRKGKLSGDVFVSGTSSGVEGVAISVKGIDPIEQTSYSYQTTTLSNGSFVITDMYVGTNIEYEIVPSYLDHDLTVTTGDTILLTPDAPEENFIIIFDNTAFVVSGQVKSQGAICGIGEIQIDYYETINGVETLSDTTRTDEEGYYSMIVNPNVSNLNEIKIKVGNIQKFVEDQGDTSIVQYDFIPSEKVYTNFGSFPIETKLDFEDQLTYPVIVSVENTCGNPLANQPVIIRVSSDDGCFEYNRNTDNFGEVEINLTPKNYLLAIEGIVGSGVDNYENAGVDFLSLRPVSLDLLALHIEAADADTLPEIDPVRFIYHRAIDFAFTTSFDRFLCNESENAPILKQGESYNLDFVLTENHRPGESCEVTEGYIVVRNSGATVVVDTIDLVGSSFESYSFKAGLPNLVAPHMLGISLQYFSDQGSLLGSKTIPIIVEGQRLLPGTGITTDALTDEAGNLQMPLLVLRDPPGDGSYSTIESGSTITKSLEFNSEVSGSAGFFLDSEFAIFGVGAFATVDVGVGGGNGDGQSYDFGITTTQSYSTSDSDDAVGREANVIVGAGISTQYGLTQVLEFDSITNCTPRNFQIIGEGLGGFESTYGYTVAFIEGLIEGYRQDSILVEEDLLPVTRPDGSFYSKDEARERFAALISSWEEMLHYHDVETVPHYVLCNDFSYRDDLDANAEALYDGWRNGFCNQIGTYVGDDFIMDEEIIWSPALISAYNNSIAFTDKIKGLPRDFIDNGDLNVNGYDIAANGLSVTNQFHNLLGNSAKSAEVFDISGNVNFSRTVTAQQSSSTSKSFSRYFYLDIAAGGSVENETFVGIAILSSITKIKAKIGARVKGDASLSVSKSQAESNETTISYNIFDDDAEDQVTFLALQAPLQDQTPYFIRLGGLSSCPQEEALTLNQDNSPLLIDDPTISVIIRDDEDEPSAFACPPPVYDVEPDEVALFEIQMANLGPTGQSRDVQVFLDLESNPFGAILKLGGSNLNVVSPEFTIPGGPAGGSITQFLTIERPAFTPFYVFEGLRVGIRPACGGEAKYIKLDVYFESPCSPISVTKPFEGFTVRRINPFITNDREVIQYELRDFQVDNELLEFVQLQYKRLGTGTDWQNVPGGRFERQTLADTVAQLPNGQDPLYSHEWDITGEYNLYPDGQYMVRAYAFCGENGRQYSNETEITLARSGVLITGYPQPEDGRWVDGDEISATYTTDIDCGIYNVLDDEDISEYLTLIDLATMMPVPFIHQCQNNKLTLTPTGNMELYDGHTLRATYKGITNILGNKAQDVIWDFEVITQSVDWDEQIVEVTLYENEIKTISTSLFNSTGVIVNGLTLSGTEPWYSFDPSSFSVLPDGLLVDLTFDGSIGAGEYMTTLQLNGLVGRQPTIVIKLNVLQSVPTPTIAMYSDSMELVVNWSFFTNPLVPSTDVNDVIQVYKDGLIRGYATIEEQGNFYFARIKVYGNVDDEDGELDFVIWNADEAQAYTTIGHNIITFEANMVRGVLSNPEMLLVEDDLFEFRTKIYVDSMNVAGVRDGRSWATAFDNLQDALAVANDYDTIWMASGTYFPSVGDRSESFNINEAVAIVGGFQTGMTSTNERTGNDETILSGNIGIRSIASDNSYHVVKSTAAGILLDMISITRGNADGVGEEAKGGCLYNTGQVSLINCSMSNGEAQEAGALIYSNGILLIDSGIYYIPDVSGVSNLFNDAGGIITIKKTVKMQKQ